MVENVLLVTVDSLRADHFGRTGSVETATTIERVADEGVNFTRAFATGPGTTPSFPALLTGTLPLSYGGLGPLTDERPRLSIHLQAAGLATGAFQCNPFLSTHFNYDVGYDTFEDYQNPLMGIATRIFPRGIEINNPKLRRVDDILHLTDAIKKSYQLVRGKPRPYVSAEVITDDTIAWLEDTNVPFYCWTHYMDVHHPCFPPSAYRESYDVGDVTQSEVSEWYSALVRNPETLTETEIEKLESLYRAAIDYIDDQIERIITHLKKVDQYDDTLVIVTSDHGELFGEHGQYGKPERLYDELLHVPLVVANGPDWLRGAADELVSLLDIPPLIHHALDIEVPDVYQGRCPGRDQPRDHVIGEHEVEGDVIVGARNREWLYEADEIAGEQRLFDVRDGFRSVPVSTIAKNTDAEQLRTIVDERLDRLDIDARQLRDAVEGDVEERLEDLGYL